MFEFDFEKLTVYQFSIKLFRKILSITKELPRNLQFSLGEQIRRATLSICNNLAEGSGKESKKEKTYFYGVSLNSARECIPMITILFEEEIIKEELYIELRKSYYEITSMLKGLIRSLNQ
ncbi:hypothetical protein A3J90_02470 [candidate division WOR-1 bacterium RIFOXYC2_FULL_37_10]|uniref:Four helix bundle protein n=1 Tax=candidate division WOR-1 bacterium RIFOXYB2_FULL_37_13 TaxID=1802579 RepID=A0A1F4SNQ8_UNCSA|nr:MAG: hypothetical protein A2310_08030 [candidate division WOR-1 bacterium RIFOXYB2_FULL_37_13]OGC35625.1 MAG: hypothetical protein A3J90_02470 [candidate division WOR-1 bacterium RIFOXYC2_FULL_37_10]